MVPRPVATLVARDEAVNVATVRPQQTRTAIEVIDELVHDDDPIQPHRLDLLIRELQIDEARDLGIRGGELALDGVGVDRLYGPVAALEEASFQDSDIGRHAFGRPEV